MKFYTAQTDGGDTISTYLTMAEARMAITLTGAPGAIMVDDVPVTAESIRLLLAGHGGYATSVRNVEIK